MTIIVIAEDFLWLSHTIPFIDFQLFFIMFEGGQVAAAKKLDGSVIHCQLPTVDKISDPKDTSKEMKLFKHQVMNRSDVGKSKLVESSSESKVFNEDDSSVIATCTDQTKMIEATSKPKVQSDNIDEEVSSDHTVIIRNMIIMLTVPVWTMSRMYLLISPLIPMKWPNKTHAYLYTMRKTYLLIEQLIQMK